MLSLGATAWASADVNDTIASGWEDIEFVVEDGTPEWVEIVEIKHSDDEEQVSGEDVVYKVVEQMPEFPGGTDALFKYIADNLRYPKIAKENKIQGRTICQFVVERDGSISDIMVIRPAGDLSLDREAVRIIRSMPRWKPGKMRGTPVRVLYTVPINFRL